MTNKLDKLRETTSANRAAIPDEWNELVRVAATDVETLTAGEGSGFAILAAVQIMVNFIHAVPDPPSVDQILMLMAMIGDEIYVRGQNGETQTDTDTTA